MFVELNRISLGRTSLTVNGDLSVVTAINQSLSGLPKRSHRPTASFREASSSTG